MCLNEAFGQNCVVMNGGTRSNCKKNKFVCFVILIPTKEVLFDSSEEGVLLSSGIIEKYYRRGMKTPVSSRYLGVVSVRLRSRIQFPSTVSHAGQKGNTQRPGPYRTRER